LRESAMVDARPVAGCEIDLSVYRSSLCDLDTFRKTGRVTKVVGLVIEGAGPRLPVGGIVLIHPGEGDGPIEAEVVGFSENSVYLMPLGDARGIVPRDEIRAVRDRSTVGVGRSMLGRVLDGIGRPLDGLGEVDCDSQWPIYGVSSNPAARRRIDSAMDVGIRAINGLLTIGLGQKVGIFSGSGVGKSVLMGMIARHCSADVNVIALIGERGKEVREFLERDLGQAGLRRSVVVCATSDRSPLERMRGAFFATGIAEYFRSHGMNVLLMMDSLTRFAMARREIGLSIGEPPTARGYTPSVFTSMGQMLERAGTREGPGSITGIYTVLVEADDLNDPVGDAARSFLDGHIVLSRRLAEQNHYPAVDVLASASRAMSDITDKEHRDYVGRFRSLLATYRDSEDLLKIGAYQSGSDKELDKAISRYPLLVKYLRQDVNESAGLAESMIGLAESLEG